MSWVNKAGLTMLLLAMEHATQATDKGESLKRIQHEDDLQHCLCKAKRGQRGVPNASILDDGNTKQEKWIIQDQQMPIFHKRPKKK